MTNDRSHLTAIVDALARVNVLCVGDVMLDRFVYGNVERISPEAPIPVLRVERETAMLGGAGNVVRNLVSLGAKVRFVSAVGDDAAGQEIKNLLEGDKKIIPALIAEKSRQTTIKTRLIAGAQQMLRADRETIEPVSKATRNNLLEEAGRIISKVDVVVLSDYGKGVLTLELTRDLIAAAREAGKPVIVDPKGADYEHYRGANVLTPNRRELGQASRQPVTNGDEIATAANALIESCSVDAVLATRGQDGMTLVTAQGEVRHLAAEAREVYDVSGAGDTVAATLAAALGAGAGLADAAVLANAAAGIVVGKVGTACVYADDLAAALLHHDISSAEAKVMSLRPGLERIEKWRLDGLKIGFTNGCFDLLHPGHVSLLSQAAAACDRLVVGLNSDASAKRLKGDSRPVQSEAARAQVLASLASVHMVVIFSDDTPLKLIEAIQPDVLVKGADYAIGQVVGADLVKGYGGEVLLAKLEKGHSTTATIARMAE
ncbi:MAG: D-glycero-beta-D-manno-heptose-7-phosphate kinase [Rhodospirillales bacterium]